MTKTEILSRLADTGLVAIVRADSSEQFSEVVGALAEGGIGAVELTLTTPNALEAISAAAKKFAAHPKVVIGVGSVTTAEQARQAIAAGAEFVVTPVMRPEIIAACRELEKPIACGAFTPTEMLAAHDAGADFVKAFPADSMGPAYIKAVRAPLPQLRIIPTGGVNLTNVKAFLDAGCVGLGLGGNLVSKEVLKSRDWAKLAATAREYVAAVRAARS